MPSPNSSLELIKIQSDCNHATFTAGRIGQAAAAVHVLVARMCVLEWDTLLLLQVLVARMCLLEREKLLLLKFWWYK